MHIASSLPVLRALLSALAFLIAPGVLAREPEQASHRLWMVDATRWPNGWSEVQTWANGASYRCLSTIDFGLFDPVPFIETTEGRLSMFLFSIPATEAKERWAREREAADPPEPRLSRSARPSSSGWRRGRDRGPTAD